MDSKSLADARAMDILESTTFCDGVRYHVGILWADSHSTLPNNYYASLAQLKSLDKRLKNDPSLNERYAKTITDDLDKGYIRVVSSEELASSTPREWYLPHHPVLNPNKLLDRTIIWSADPDSTDFEPVEVRLNVESSRVQASTTW